MRRASKTLRDLFGKEKSLKHFLSIEHKIKEGGVLEFTNHPFFTSHGTKHVAFVENVVDSLLPLNIKKEMNPLEVSILLLSILLHDIGMIPESNETLKNIREVHNIRTREIINKYYPEIGIDKIQAEIIGDICYAHRDHLLDGIKFNTLDEIKKRPYQINLVKIRGNFLASLIRLADELDITYSRAPEFIQKVAKPDESHKEHWDTHNLIAGIDIDSSQWKIEIKPTKPPSINSIPKWYQLIENKRGKIQKELDNIRQREIFQNYGIEYANISVDWENYFIFANESINSKLLQQRILKGMGYLLKIELPEGGWGVRPNSNFRILTTSEVILAILQSSNLRSEEKNMMYSAINKIFENQCSDGGFPSKTYDTFTARCSSSTECTSWVLYICLAYSETFKELNIQDRINDALEWLKSNFDEHLGGWGLWLGEPVRLYPTMWAMRAMNKSKSISDNNYEKFLDKIFELHSSDDGHLFGFYPNSASNVPISSLFLIFVDEIRSTRKDLYNKYRKKFEEYETKIINYIFSEQKGFAWIEKEEIKHHFTVRAKDGEQIKFPFTHVSLLYAITALLHYLDKLDNTQKLKLKGSIAMLLALQDSDGKFRMVNSSVPIDYTFTSSLAVSAISYADKKIKR